MPALVGCKAIGCNANLTCHDRLEFIVRDFEEGEKFAYQHPHVALVDQGEAEIERSSSDTNIWIPQTIKNGVSVPLDCIGFYRNYLDKSVQCNVSNIVVSVRKEFPQDVNT